jgi:hypothetical protein
MKVRHSFAKAGPKNITWLTEFFEAIILLDPESNVGNDGSFFPEFRDCEKKGAKEL